MELRTAFVQVVMGMLRYKKVTGNYRIMHKYQYMKSHKGSGKSIIATARKVSTIIYAILQSGQPFDPAKLKFVDTKTDSIPIEKLLALAG